MCGRYTLKTDRSQIEKRFGVEELPPFEPRYNLAPTQDGLVILPGAQPGTRTAAWLQWGLVPSWSKSPGSGPVLINARSETAATKPAFRDAFRRRRCLVIADGFYEWTRTGSLRTPHHFTVRHGEPFAMAGLWERWSPPAADPGEARRTFAVLTTVANAIVAPHHERMPVILGPELYDDWLNPLLHDPETLQRMLRPFPALEMLARAVSTRVNNIKNDDPACLTSPEIAEGAVVNESAADPRTGQLGLDLG
jgi:putative SOS response-associated peptidase YedK